MGNIGPGELLIIALIALLLFGAGRIADIGKGLGQGISNFKKGLKEAESDGDEEEEVAAKPAKKKKTDDDVVAKKIVKTRVETTEEEEEEVAAKPSKKVEKEA